MIFSKNNPKTCTLWDRFEQLSFLFFCVCILDCCLTGAGRYVSIGPLSPRMIFGFLSLLFILPKFFLNLRSVLRNPIFIAFLVFLVYMGICAVRGFLADNLRSVLISDIKGFLWLYLVPIAVLTVTTEKRMNTVLNCVMIGAVLQTLLVLYTNTVCSIVPAGISIFYQPFLDIGIGSVFDMSKDITRIFLKSCPYMVFACSIAIFKQIKAKRINWLYVAAIALWLVACLLSFTRALYGCIFVVAGLSVLALLVFYPKQWRRWVACILIAVVGFGVCTFALEKIFDARYVDFALYRTFGIPYEEEPEATEPPVTEPTQAPTTEPTTPTTKPTEPTKPTKPTKPTEPAKPTPPTPVADPDLQLEFYQDNQTYSNEVRAITLAELTALIRQNPVFGNGLGASAPSRNGPDEYFYHDMLARMGIVGLILYLIPFGLVLLHCFRNRKTLVQMPLIFSILCGMCGFWAITFFNPWMNAALGIAMYAVCCAVPGILNVSKTEIHIKE